MLVLYYFHKKMAQRICIKFCYKSGIKCSSIIEMLNIAFGESVMNKKRFMSGIRISKKVLMMVMNVQDALITSRTDDGIMIDSYHEICGETIHGLCNMIIHLLNTSVLV